MSRVSCKHSSCNRSFESEACMLQHYADTHSTSKRRPCRICGRSFELTSAMEQHCAARHTSNATQQSRGTRQPPPSAASVQKAAPPAGHMKLGIQQGRCTRRAALRQKVAPPDEQLESSRRNIQQLLQSMLLSASGAGRSTNNHVSNCKCSVSGYSTRAAAGCQASCSYNTAMVEVSCNDCGRHFKGIDALHQHQWDSPDHTRVSRARMPRHGYDARECSRCSAAFGNAMDLEKHFMNVHPLKELIPHLSEEDSRTWHHISSSFTSSWRWRSSAVPDRPTVHKIYKVYNMGWRRRQFEDYRKQLKHQISILSINKQHQEEQEKGREEEEEAKRRVLVDGNELSRFHGTTVRCRLGRATTAALHDNHGLHHGKLDGRRDAVHEQLCADAECSLCGILKQGFKTSKCRAGVFQRFGRGIYVTATSSKSNDYVRCCDNDHDISSSGVVLGLQRQQLKVMLVCKVLAGRVHKSTYNMSHLTCAPPGFHSVQGVPGPVLNYDELVVYDDRAILPAFIILYSTSV